MTTPTVHGWKTRLRNLSIRKKLKGIILVTSGTSILLACLAFFVYDALSFRAAAARRLETLGELVANQSTASVSFNDAKSAVEILRSLSAETHIESAAIYDGGGKLLAKYFRDGAALPTVPTAPGPLGVGVGRHSLTVTVPMILEGERIGSVYLQSSLQEMSSRLELNSAIVAGVLLAALVAALLLASRLEGSLTRPILNLASTARVVSQDKNYSLRAEKTAGDELGQLTDGFNEMLGQIQTRDLALQRSREDLEQRVEARTAELSAEVAERRKVQESLAEREAQYRDLVERSPDAIVIHVEGTLVFANGAAAALLGSPASERLLNEHLLTFVHPEYQAALVEQIRKLFQEGQNVPLHEMKIRRLDGRVLDIEAAASPLRYGGRAAAQLVMRDITKRKELDRLKSEFISTVSHELRTPLTSIRGSLGLIGGGATGPLTPMAKNLIDIASNNCQRLVRLINDILDIEKIAAGKMEFQMKPQGLMPLVTQSLEINRDFACQVGVSLALAGGLEGGLAVLDSDRFLQIMSNLLSNAAKFSPKGETVEVSVARIGDTLRVSVSDRGPGIPEEFRSRIFQKFAQADSSDTKQKGGTGLGLSITKALIERMGGGISFESRAGGGTVFHVDFPEYRSAPVAAPAGPKSDRRLLIVEDNHDVAHLLKLMVEQMGYSADVAYTSSQARLRLAENAYHAMTLDIMLPDESGILLLQRIRKDPRTRQLPVVVISAKAELTRRELEGSALSVLDWIEKPIDEAHLTAALRSAIQLPRGGRPRILHVEDESDIRDLVQLSLRDVGDVVPAGSLAEARALLEREEFDLAVLDLLLPDGWGMELAPALCRAGRLPVPIVVFSALDARRRAREQVVATLVKSTVTHEQLQETIKAALAPAGFPATLPAGAPSQICS